MQLPDISGLRVHGSAARDRWSGRDGTDAVPAGSIPERAVPVLRASEGSVKGLYWEGDGFVLLYKRLKNGSFQWPRNGEEARQLTPQQYRWLMEGLSVEQPKAHRTVSGLNIV